MKPWQYIRYLANHNVTGGNCFIHNVQIAEEGQEVKYFNELALEWGQYYVGSSITKL